MKFIFLNLKKILFCKIYFKIPKPSKIVVYDRGHSELIKKLVREIMTEAIHHSQARFLYVPKRDIKKAIKIVKSMPFSLKGNGQA